MDITNESLYLADTSGLESCHSRLSAEEKTHNMKISHEVGTGIHILKSLKLGMLTKK